MHFIDLGAQQARIREKLDRRIAAVLDGGKYIMGPELRELEDRLSKFCGATYVKGCANGTDALQLALMALGAGPGDAIFCPSFTFAATAEVVPLTGATPVFVDSRADTFNLDTESLKRTIQHVLADGLKPTGIIPVDLFGLPADYDAIQVIADENDMWVLADSAQGFGGTYKEATAGSIGDIATTSFFPAKPLGCYGDGGAVFTDNAELASLVDSFRVHGKGSHKYDNERIGINSRLDTLQAAILLEKLAIYADEIEKRQIVANRYTEALSDHIDTPVVPNGCRSVWAQYTLKTRERQDREAIMAALKEQGVPSVVYYPMPLHLQTAYAEFPRDPEGIGVAEKLSKQVFSLPMHPYLSECEQNMVVETLLAQLG